VSYEPINPSVPPELFKLSREDLKKYNDWFVAVIPERIGVLESAVKKSPGYANWIATFDPSSLRELGDWFVSKARVRDRSEVELKEIKERLLFDMSVSDKELTNETVAIAIDLGMYFGSILLKKHPKLHWGYKADNKKFVDYGQPIIVGFGLAVLNPVRIAVNFAYGITEGTKSAERLCQLYKYWADLANSI
jgi:hypothetical protein